jgi:hypothetical protein
LYACNASIKQQEIPTYEVVECGGYLGAVETALGLWEYTKRI